jgi:hypothetical protein
MLPQRLPDSSIIKSALNRLKPLAKAIQFSSEIAGKPFYQPLSGPAIPENLA